MKAEKVTQEKFIEIMIIDLGRWKLAEKSACSIILSISIAISELD